MSSRRAARRTKFAGSHQKSWLWGRHAVLEAVRGGRWPVRELYVSDEADAQLSDDRARLLAADIPICPTAPARITQLCGHRDHQGFAARMAPFPLLSNAELETAVCNALDSAVPPSVPPLYVICDRIQDAHNLGAILRNCDATSVDGVVLGTKSQAGITPHVARASSGAVNFLRIYQTDNLAETMRRLRTLGLRIVAASEKAAVPIIRAELTQPVALVIGSESQGIAPDLQEEVDTQVAIPMHGQVDSLNAAVACGILLHEARRQQGLYAP